jgi:hypothetical protein
MTPEDQAIKQLLKDNFTHYASKCLRIRTKSGSVEPFLLNKAQLHIHAELERQKGETGKVRALILKGRQQGCCFSEQMKVLLSNMTWVFIKDIKVGDELVACDEKCRVSAGVRNKSSRKFRTAIVEHIEFYDWLSYALQYSLLVIINSCIEYILSKAVVSIYVVFKV